MIGNGERVCGVQPEEEQGDQGGRETVVGEELAASELVAAASACDSAFSSSFQRELPGKMGLGGD